MNFINHLHVTVCGGGVLYEQPSTIMEQRIVEILFFFTDKVFFEIYFKQLNTFQTFEHKTVIIGIFL